MQKNLILAIALSMLILLIFQNINYKKQGVIRTVKNGQIIRKVDIKETASEDKKTTEEPAHKVELQTTNYKTAKIKNENISLEINLFDSGINRVQVMGKEEMKFFITRDISKSQLHLNEKFVGDWQIINREGNELEIKLEGNDYVLRRKYVLDDKNTLNIVTEIKNKSQAVSEYEIKQGWYNGLGTTKDLEKENYIDNRAFSRIDGLINKNMDQAEVDGNIEWAGLLNRYFTVIFMDVDSKFNKLEVVRDMKASGCSRRAPRINNIKYPSIELKADLKLAPEEKQLIKQKIYIGPKQYTALKDMKNNVDKIISLGMFGSLSRLFLNMLIFFYSIVNNYGVAIIMLTLILQVVMFPLTAKSYKSMNAMKEIQPKINDLRVKFKSDPQRLNQEMMELYKRHKVNPFGGCLPILLQMPIFISLFTMLRSAAELRYAGFLWIHDLAKADVLFTNVPGIKEIPFIGTGGPLPILMGIAMFLQQKFTGSASMDSTQKNLMYMMPIMFTFMFMKFPSGLVLYWLSNSIFTFVAQYYISKKS